MKNKNIIVVKINQEPTKLTGSKPPDLYHHRDPLDDIPKEAWEEYEKMKERFKLKNPINTEKLFIFGTGGKMDNNSNWEDFWKEEDKLKENKDENI